jgi:lipopolysaccharide export system protein LptC
VSGRVTPGLPRGPQRPPARPRALPPLSRPRRLPSAAALARRRVAVTIAKWLLPAGALLLLAAIVLWPEIESAEERGRLAFRRVGAVAPEAATVTAPRYQGLDQQGRPVTVTAERAAQRGQSSVFDLVAPRGDMLTADGAWLLGESERGVFDRSANRLDLSGRVTLWHDGGTVIATEAAQVELGGGSASGEAPVAAQGPFGMLTSEGFRVAERGRVIVFTGRSRAVLEGDSR